MGATLPFSAINRMVIRGLNKILLMSTGVIAAEVCLFAPVSALFRQPTSTLTLSDMALAGCAPAWGGDTLARILDFLSRGLNQ
jgi:hypothetical protein